jgi:hypothetical protein
MPEFITKDDVLRTLHVFANSEAQERELSEGLRDFLRDLAALKDNSVEDLVRGEEALGHA